MEELDLLYLIGKDKFTVLQLFSVTVKAKAVSGSLYEL
jgi:hypothetical protein